MMWELGATVAGDACRKGFFSKWLHQENPQSATQATSAGYAAIQHASQCTVNTLSSAAFCMHNIVQAQQVCLKKTSLIAMAEFICK